MQYYSAAERLHYQEMSQERTAGFIGKCGRNIGEYIEMETLPPWPEWTHAEEMEVLCAVTSLSSSKSELSRIQDKIRELKEIEAKELVRVEQDQKLCDAVRNRLARGQEEHRFEHRIRSVRDRLLRERIAREAERVRNAATLNG